MGFQGKVKGRRKAPYPNSIIDRRALTEALEEAGIPAKRIHLDEFYGAMHRQHYPELRKFVENYRYQAIPTDHQDENENICGQANMNVKPLKNAVRKNRRHKMHLPKAFLDYLATTEDFVSRTSRVKERLTSSDKSTTKLIVELYDGFVVESVLMRYDKKAKGRASLCVSSQCGCAMGCTFCATGTMGLSGNLTSGEILEQLVHANDILAEEHLAKSEEERSKNNLDLVRSVIFMGMGEPLDNYTNVVEACRAMIDRTRWNLAHGRVTVSTVGLISQIRRLTKELPEVSLALSLHAPNQDARTAIVPTATRYPIDQLIEVIDEHMMAYVNQRRKRTTDSYGESQVQPTTYTEEERINESKRRRVMIEYVMLQGETSSIECAHQLGKLCENRHLIVNLIPYNQTDVGDELRCPSPEDMQQFRDIVASYGSFCTIRRTMGADIASACGQLVKKQEHEEQEEKRSVDIEDVVAGQSVVVSENLDKTATGSSAKIARTSLDDPLDEKMTASWLDSLSTDDLEYWLSVLGVAATVSATCFLAASAVHLKRKA
ncbi:MAG: hypothetical protein SGILL_008890 [Bacillariaceae sp.]